MLNLLAGTDLCQRTNPNEINFKCSPLKERHWWTWDDDKVKAGMCGRSAPLFKAIMMCVILMIQATAVAVLLGIVALGLNTAPVRDALIMLPIQTC